MLESILTCLFNADFRVGKLQYVLVDIRMRCSKITDANLKDVALRQLIHWPLWDEAVNLYQ